jgi:MarR family transcriptional regulator for hemolysin
MLDIDYRKSVGHWVFTAAHAMACAMNDELAAHGITFRQFEVLAWLSRERELSQSDLAERMRIEAPTLVGVLDRMERDGWIQRIPDDNDRRKKLIRPTDRVMPAWAKMVACGEAVRARATRGLSEEQLTELREILSAICENMGVADQAVVAKEG